MCTPKSITERKDYNNRYRSVVLNLGFIWKVEKNSDTSEILGCSLGQQEVYRLLKWFYAQPEVLRTIHLDQTSRPGGRKGVGNGYWIINHHTHWIVLYLQGKFKRMYAHVWIHTWDWSQIWRNPYLLGDQMIGWMWTILEEQIGCIQGQSKPSVRVVKLMHIYRVTFDFSKAW